MTDAASRPPTDAGQEADEVEAGLWGALKRGDGAARERLFAAYAKFARRVATRHFMDRSGGDLEFPDLCQLAYAGLLEAIDRYDPGRGVPFRGFAGARISGSILDGIGRTSEVRQQISFRNRVRIERSQSLLAAPAPVMAPPDALLALTDLAVGLAVGFMLEGTSLYQADAGRDPAHDAYQSLAMKETRLRLLQAIQDLPERQQTVVRHHYIDGLSFAQIANLMNLSTGRISQIHREALTRLGQRETLRADFRFKR